MSPDTFLSTPEDAEPLARLKRLASGRRIVNLCMMSSLAAFEFGVAGSPVSWPITLAQSLAGGIGAIRITSNLSPRLRAGPEIACIVASFVPGLNLIPMAVLGMRAADQLRAAGFRVGLFEARERRAD